LCKKCQPHKLREDVMVRGRRRKLIKDDDQEVRVGDVSAGTGSPGKSRTKDRKTVVV